jgi:serine/threonine protein kinase
MSGHFESEIRLLQQMCHPQVIRLFDIFKDTLNIYIVTEYCSGGQLFDYIVDHGKLSEEKSKILIQQLLQGLLYLHTNSIAHRDLKPENILLDRNEQPKLSDFGLYKYCTAASNTHCGTPFYAPPEIIIGAPYDPFKADMWSLGVCAFTMLCGRLPWTEKNEKKLYKQITDGAYSVPATLSAPCQAFVRRLMAADPSERPSAAAALADPFLALISLKLAPTVANLPCVSLRRLDLFFYKDEPFETFDVDFATRSPRNDSRYAKVERMIVGPKSSSLPLLPTPELTGRTNSTLDVNLRRSHTRPVDDREVLDLITKVRLSRLGKVFRPPQKVKIFR